MGLPSVDTCRVIGTDMEDCPQVTHARTQCALVFNGFQCQWTVSMSRAGLVSVVQMWTSYPDLECVQPRHRRAHDVDGCRVKCWRIAGWRDVRSRPCRCQWAAGRGREGVAVERSGRTIAAILLGRASYSSSGEAEVTFGGSPTTCVVVSYTACLLDHCKVYCSVRMAAEPTSSVLGSERTGFCH